MSPPSAVTFAAQEAAESCTSTTSGEDAPEVTNGPSSTEEPLPLALWRTKTIDLQGEQCDRTFEVMQACADVLGLDGEHHRGDSVAVPEEEPPHTPPRARLFSNSEREEADPRHTYRPSPPSPRGRARSLPPMSYLKARKGMMANPRASLPVEVVAAPCAEVAPEPAPPAVAEPLHQNCQSDVVPQAVAEVPYQGCQSEAVQQAAQAACQQLCVGVPVPTRMHFYLAGDPLELMMAPGDVLMIRGTGRLAELGTAGGFMGHVLVIISAPVNVPRHSSASSELLPLWPANDVTELWKVRTVECTRREHGLYECETLLYVDRSSRQLLMIGEVDLDGEVNACDAAPVEVWQSPEELRAELCIDVMDQVLAEMRSNWANWSAATAARAMMKPAAVAAKRSAAETLEEVQACWRRPPICTSVVITFWQRYICRLAAAQPICNAGWNGSLFLVGERVMYWSESFHQWMDAVVVCQNLDQHGAVASYNLDCKVGALAGNIRRPAQVLDISVKAVEMILKHMPLKADRALPGDLLRSMRECGWVCVPQLPRIFRPTVVPQFAPPVTQLPVGAEDSPGRMPCMVSV